MKLNNIELTQHVNTLITALDQYSSELNTEERLLNEILDKIKAIDNLEALEYDIVDLMNMIATAYYVKGIKAGIQIQSLL